MRCSKCCHYCSGECYKPTNIDDKLTFPQKQFRLKVGECERFYPSEPWTRMNLVGWVIACGSIGGFIIPAFIGLLLYAIIGVGSPFSFVIGTIIFGVILGIFLCVLGRVIQHICFWKCIFLKSFMPYWVWDPERNGTREVKEEVSTPIESRFEILDFEE